MRGFTIVELLIVIVVIAIIAMIVIVAYQAVQERARLQVARSDMRTFGQTISLYYVNHDSYPTTVGDFTQILKDAQLYESTRSSTKSYAICASSGGYAFVAWEPIIGGVFKDDILYIYSSGTGQSTHTLTNSSLNSSNTIDKVCDQTYPGSTLDVWSYDVP